MIDEAVRRVISVGGRLGQIAGLDNFCWPDPVLSEKTPDGPYKMAQLVRANKALYDVCTAFKVPPISGKDSMKNDSVRGGRKISIPPTVLFSTIAKMDDVRRAVTMHFKKAGDLIYVDRPDEERAGRVGVFTACWREEQGAPRAIGGEVPKLDVPLALAHLPRDGRGDGGRACCVRPTRRRSAGWPSRLRWRPSGGDLGAEIDLDGDPDGRGSDDDTLLFSESNSRFVVTCAPEKAAELESLFSGLPLRARRHGDGAADAEDRRCDRRGNRRFESIRRLCGIEPHSRRRFMDHL